MSFKTIVAILQSERDASRVLDCALPLTQQFDAHLIGVHAEAMPVPYTSASGFPDTEFLQVSADLNKERAGKLKAAFTQRVAQELAQHPRLVLICGRYEGGDERVRQTVVTDEISIGDYVLTGGELAAMVIVDAVARLIPGVLGARWGAEEDSHAMGLLEYPHYTRPPEYRGLKVPDVLLAGDHEAVDRWRRREAIRRTWRRRPDLLLAADLSAEERWFLAELAEQDAPMLV